MKEVVDEILAAEKKVEETLQAARLKAAQIRQENDQEVSALLARAHDDAQQTLKDTVETARSEAQESRKKALEGTEAEKQLLFEKSRSTLDTLVDEISDLISYPVSSSGSSTR